MKLGRRTVVSGLRASWLAIAVLAGVLSAQGRRLNALLLPEIAGDLQEFVIDPAGARVVYRADQETLDVRELYAVPVDGSAAPVKLSGTMTAGGDVANVVDVPGSPPAFAFSPDGARVLYIADQLVDETFELFRVLADGSASPVRVNTALAAGGDVDSFRIGPDGARLVYRADQTTNDLFELYSAPLGGGGPVRRLNTRSNGQYEISPDGSRVVLIDGGLYSVPTDGSAPRVRLDAPLHATADVTSFRIAPQGGRVVYLADDNVNGRYELFSVPIDGSAAPEELNGPMIAAGDVSDDYKISPDGERVVYRADQETDHVVELYSAMLARRKVRWFGDGRLVKLNDPLAFSGVTNFEISPDGTRVVYRAQQLNDITLELHARRINGRGPSVKLNGPFGLSGQVWEFRISPDGGHVVYRAEQDTPGAFELYSAPLDGSGWVKLNDTVLPDDEEIEDFVVTPDGQRVVYERILGDRKDSAAFSDLLVVPIDRSQPPAPVTSQEPGDHIEVLAMAPGGERVVYRVLHALSTYWTHGLYGVALDGSPEEQLHPDLAAGDVLRDVESFQWSPDGSSVVYLADQDTNDLLELYVARRDGRGSPVKRNGPLLPYQQVAGNYRIAPDGTRVVFEVGGSGDGQLFSVTIDGSAPPVALLPPLGPSQSAFQFAISPDSSRVVYVADQDTYNVFELYSVPIDGSMAPVKLSGPMVAGGDLQWYGNVQIAPNGARVVYVADQATDNVFELYSVPIDGSAGPVKLSAISMTPGGGVTSSGFGDAFRIAPDSSRVVYRADQSTDEVFELFRAPLDGSAPPVKVSGTMGFDGDVTTSAAPGDFQISADGLRVVFRADRITDEVFELFSARLDVPATPVKLSGTMIAGGDVLAGSAGYSAFRLSPDGARVVFRADRQLDERFELYGVPIDGSAAPVKLNGTLVAGGDVAAPEGYAGPGALEIDPLGACVVYIADASTDDRYELWRAPLDGSSAPTKLSGPLGAGDVMSFQLAPDGSRLVFRSDRDADDVFELYRAPLDASALPAKLHRDLAGARDVSATYAVGPDSTRVVYLGDVEADDVNELWLSALAHRPQLAPSTLERP